MTQPFNFLLVGVGGQGTILASDILANVGLAAGLQATQAEVHGMSQRGGSVTSHVRWGQVIHSPLIGAGEVDALLAFEKLEALRYLSQLRHNGLALINLETITPITVTSLGQHYPDDGTLRSAFARVTPRAVYIDGLGVARSLGEPKVANVVLLGALSALLEGNDVAAIAPKEALWLEVIARLTPPKYLSLNHQAFEAGRAAGAAPVSNLLW
jgi:indolepyruvate ferredoxin oxidoreductase beta subunit